MSTQDDNDKTNFKKPSSESNQEDRTRFAVKKTPASTPASEPDGSDKTRMKAPPPPATPPASDKTRVVTKKTTPPASGAAIPSVTTPGVATPGVTTPGTSAPRPTPAPAEPPSDKTRFTPPKAPITIQPMPASPKSAAAKISEEHANSEYGMLKNRFVFEEVLGAGGMGVVYKAKDLLKVEAQDRDPYVAIKVLSEEFKSHPEAFIALQRESRKTQKIAHPNIVNVHDFDRDGDQVFMTMEFMEGKPLDKLIAQHRGVGLPYDEVCKILEGISAALIYAHGQDIIHSDFKPGNIFVSSSGVAKVFDFGIARAVAKAEHREESKDDRTVFDAGNLGALTPAYASLEMLNGENPDVRDDIYALGCIAYELFTGVHPYNRMHADEAKRQKVKLRRIPNITKQEWKAIEHALAFKREDRTESVAAFWKEFTRKKTHLGKRIFAVFLLVIAAMGGTYYQFVVRQQPAMSEEEMKNQLESKLRLEYEMKSLEDTYKSADFTPPWEEEVWTKVQNLRKIIGKDGEWMVKTEVAIYALYVKKIEEVLAAGNFKLAQTLTANAYRYTTNPQQLKELEAKIAKAIEDKQRAEEELARQQQAQAQVKQQERQQIAKENEIVAQKNTSFEAALTNVKTQLECRINIDMKDFEIAITKLRSVDMPRYQKEEPNITALLAQCIEKVGASFPERAEESKKYALRLFKDNPVILGIKIVVKDACSSSIAGLGSRGMGATCRDKLNGASKAPVLVVIPAKGSIKGFAIGKYEVSVDEMNEFCQQTKSCDLSGAAESTLPATNISFSNANAYVKWLSEKSGKQYRLPNITEWQYAAKAETPRIDPNRNCKLNSRGIQKGDSLIKASVGQQNAWGLVNYLGNAREWVVNVSGGTLAVGGSYDTPMEECDLNNSASHSGQPDNQTGFRVLREIVN